MLKDGMDRTKAYVYLLSNKKGNVLYTGSTNDLRKRIYHHKHRLIPGFTKKYNVDRLIYFEEVLDMDEARTREKQIKGKSRIKKDKMIAKKNPKCLDLSQDFD